MTIGSENLTNTGRYIGHGLETPWGMDVKSFLAAFEESQGGPSEKDGWYEDAKNLGQCLLELVEKFFKMLSILTTTNSPDERERKLSVAVLNFCMLITSSGIGKWPIATLCMTCTCISLYIHTWLHFMDRETKVTVWGMVPKDRQLQRDRVKMKTQTPKSPSNVLWDLSVVICSSSTRADSGP